MNVDFAAPLKGALAGVTGTVAMTLALRRALPRLLPPRAQRGFLPQRVVRGVERKVAGRRRLRPAARRKITMPAHYAYGAGAGLGYGLLRAGLPAAPLVALGTGWGLAVWAASYQAWLPAAGIVPATTDRPPAQWLVPIAAHVIFGVATAYAYEAFSAEPEGART